VHADILERRQLEIAHKGERNGMLSGKFRRIKEHKLVNDARGQGSAIERGTSFQQNAQDFAAAQLVENGV